MRRSTTPPISSTATDCSRPHLPSSFHRRRAAMCVRSCCYQPRTSAGHPKRGRAACPRGSAIRRRRAPIHRMFQHHRHVEPLFSSEHLSLSDRLTFSPATVEKVPLRRGNSVGFRRRSGAPSLPAPNESNLVIAHRTDQHERLGERRLQQALCSAALGLVTALRCTAKALTGRVARPSTGKR